MRSTVLRLYPPREDFQKALKGDAAEYQSALDKLGIRPGRPDPVSATTRGYLTEVDLRLAAAEAWLRPDEARAALKTRPKIRGDGLEGLLPSGGTIQRDTFETWFRVLLYHGHKGVIELPRPDTSRPKPKATREVEVGKGDAARLANVELDLGRGGKAGRLPTIDPTFRTVAATGSDEPNRLRLFDLKTGKLLHHLDDYADGKVKRWEFSPDGAIVAVETERMVRFIVVETGQEKSRTKKVGFGAMGFTPDGKELVTRGPEGLEFLRPESGDARRRLKYTDTASKLVCTPDGRFLLVADGRDFGGARMVDAQSGGHKPLPEPPGAGYVTSITCSPDGKLIVVTYSRNSFKVFDAATRDDVAVERVTFRGQTARPATWGAAFSRDAKYLAVVHGEGILTLWAAEPLQLLSSVQAEEGDVLRTVQFSPDGKRLATATSGGLVRFWDVEAMVKSGE